MIPRDYIAEWGEKAPWAEAFMVEQDLIVSRALVEMFSNPALAEGLAFRGGTALYKLYLVPPARYSEDIDVVQVLPGPVGALLGALHETLDPWLGTPRWSQKEGRITFIYRLWSEEAPPQRLRLKIEINTREHFSVFGFKGIPFSVESRWFDGAVDIPTYELEELLATKMRALYQQKKGRDLFDLDTGLSREATNADRIVEAFNEYLAREGSCVTRAMFEMNLSQKLRDPRFVGDITPLLSSGAEWDMANAAQAVFERLVALLPGEPWKGTG